MTNEKENDNLGETCQVRVLVPPGPGESVLMPDIYTQNHRPAPNIVLEDQLKRPTQ